MTKINKIIKYVFRFFLYIFAIIGFIFCGVFVAMKLHLTNVRGSIDERNSFFNEVKNTEDRINLNKNVNADWFSSSEWQTLREGIIKDSNLIIKVSNEAEISPRLLVASVIPEQLRFFTSNRESFKKYFEPLKILGTYTQFSYGISGIKMETAKKIEENLKDKNSVYYLGEKYENILDYDLPKDIDNQRLARFTDSHNHYYSYLYTAIFLKQIMAEWQRAGSPIDDRPEVLATIFNLGFNGSKPNSSPEAGGSVITISGKDYTFGGLAYDFYYSEELSDILGFAVEY